MSRIALGIEYDGSSFSGWQEQTNAPSVQENVEKSISKIANEPIKITCAGRTDAGVHAIEQVVHFDSNSARNERSWVFGTNRYLLPEIRVNWAKIVPPHFSARYSATIRHYRYLIYNHPIRPSLLRHYVGWYYGTLEIERMLEASKYWLGMHDFSSFRAARCQSHTPMRNIHSIAIKREGDKVILDFAANAFLYHMVRNMVGTLIQIGAGLKDPSWAKEVLLACDRRRASITASPSGLYLTSIQYPKEFALPENTDFSLLRGFI